MSITISNCNEICNSPTNTSHAKMLYTFSKQSRFPNRIRVLCDKFYTSHHSPGRATSLGYSHKYDFTKDVPKSPPPNTYQIKSDFQKNCKKGVGFGQGRQEMTITGPFFTSAKNKNPGPGNYETRSSLNRTSYSMSGKNYLQDKQKMKIPGPGTYESTFGLSPKGKYFLAKHRSSFIRNFNHCAKRDGPCIISTTPGPGKYNCKTQQMSPQGTYFLSKMQNSMSRKFGTSVRQPLGQKTNTPGPGNYKLPSQFGHYLAKNACQAEKGSRVQQLKQNQE